MSNTITFFRKDWEDKKQNCQYLIEHALEQMRSATNREHRYRWFSYLTGLEAYHKALKELENQDIDFNK